MWRLELEMVVRERIAHKHTKVNLVCFKCGREINIGEKYYRTGRNRISASKIGEKYYSKRAKNKHSFGIRNLCSDCIDSIYVDA